MNVRRLIHDLYRQHRPMPPEAFWAAGGCLAFPGKVAEAITGTDPTTEFRAGFSTEAEAKRSMVLAGCGNMADAAALAYPEIPASQARAGDWAVVANEDGTDGLGVVMGSQIVVPTLKGGLWHYGLLPLTRATSAYRVA